MPDDPAVTISVAVCTKDRPEQLQRLLESIVRQSCKPAEVLVIDNAPTTDHAQRMVRQCFPTCRYIHEPVPGLDFARNRAVREAGSDVVAFIDDDAVAANDWVEATMRVFAESPRIAVCTGRIDALSLEHDGARLFESTGGFRCGERRIHLPPGAGPTPPGLPRPLVAWSVGVGFGASLAVRRAVVQELGGFDEALDMGAVLPGGGDQDIIWRALEAGFEVVYEPSVRARHEHRRELRDAELQILGHGRALIAMLTKFLRVAPWRRKLPVLVFLAWRLMKPFVRLLRRTAGKDPLPARLLWRLVGHTWRGLVAYPVARRLSAERLAAVHGRAERRI
jgi:GT2 family glycosyltransferase